jgi:hypothetical protein
MAPDADMDGVDSVTCGGLDCDDADAMRFPGRPEVCDGDAHDEDCDSGTIGDLDADGDGVVAAMCCNVSSTGDRLCGRDCDDASATSNPTSPEVCDGLDNDCDENVDEGFECLPGMMRACAICSGTGMQTCDAATCSYGACTTDEACNACDDDSDGAIDEDFMCQRGATTACTNECGTEAVGTCSMTCDGVEACVTPGEVCNYCDDDGDGTVDDELSLAVIDDRVVFDCMPDPMFPDTGDDAIVTLTDATCTPVAGTFLRRADVLDTGGRADSGAFSYEIPMGFGRISVNLSARWQKAVATGSTGGWALVFIAEGTLSLSNAAPGYNRAMVTRGFAVEWDFNGTMGDTLSLVRLDGTAAGSTITGTSTDVAIGTLSTSYNAQTTGVPQNLFVEYQPVVVGVPASGNAIRVAHFDPASSGTGIDNVRINVNSASLMGELQPGDNVTIAAVAGESSSVTTGSFNIGWDWPIRAVSFAQGRTLCATYP